MSDSKKTQLDQDALAMHASGRPGKIEISPTKPLTTQRDLALAYSPGVAAPCLAIQDDPDCAYDYTAKGNTVAVISNGSAVLGLGNLGALASKPVMEGKAVLFKRFADIDGIDLEVSTEDVDEFVNCVRLLGASYGGINLEDIKAPECFIIEQRLREEMDIPVFHDDQHGTAIISAAGLINACQLTGRDLKDVRMVVNGAGAAAIACVELAKAMGVAHDHVILCDSKGVIYKGRDAGMNQWKSAHAVDTDCRTLADALNGADVFYGLSVKGAVTPEMVKSMAEHPIIFAMANPDPEITPEEVAAVRDDAIMATGRSDYPNQVNNVLGFPYIFRGALDVRARTINDEMKIAAAKAIAALAREDVPEDVATAYAGRHLKYGRNYLIPVPFDARLISSVPPAVAEAAMESGVAGKTIEDLDAYREKLLARLDPTAATLEAIAQDVVAAPQRVVFAEGEEEKMIRAAMAYRSAGYGTPILLGREDRIAKKITALGLTMKDLEGVEITNAKISDHNEAYIDWLYGRLQRRGALLRDCQRMVNQDRNSFAACMVENGHADAMVTGLTRNYWQAYDDVRRVIDADDGQLVFGVVAMVIRGQPMLFADTAIHERPTAENLVDIARQTASMARAIGLEPRVAFLSYSNFGNPPGGIADRVREAVSIMEQHGVDFEFDGEMGVDVALDGYKSSLYPFTRLSGPANIMILPGLHAANISYKLLHHFAGGTRIGPLLVGLEKPVQIVNMDASVSEVVQIAIMAAHQAMRQSHGRLL